MSITSKKSFQENKNIYNMILIISLKYLTLLLEVGHNKIANQALKTGFWATSELYKHSQSALIVTVSNWAENTHACASYVRTNPVGWSRQVYLNIACYWATGRRAVRGGGVSEWLNASQCSNVFGFGKSESVHLNNSCQWANSKKPIHQLIWINTKECCQKSLFYSFSLNKKKKDILVI